VIDRVPRIIGAEVFGALENALVNEMDHTEAMPTYKTVAVSTGTANSAYQSLRAVRESGGWAGRADDEDAIMRMQLALAEDEGLYAEASSVVPLVVAEKLLKAGRIKRDEVVVAVSTSSGLKDPEVTAPYLRDIPLAEPTPEGLAKVLREVYDHKLEGAGVA
jgi:threonine synthase